MTDTQPSASEAHDGGPPPVPAGLADERFAVRIREERERQGKSQADIARLMKERGWAWHPQTVQRAEAGHRKVTVGEAEAIAHILHTTVDRLTWPGRAASAAGLMDMSIGRALSAWEQIAAHTAHMLWAQRQLATTLGETERADFHGSDKIRQIADEARQVLQSTPEAAVEAGRKDFDQLVADGGSLDDEEDAG